MSGYSEARSTHAVRARLRLDLHRVPAPLREPDELHRAAELLPAALPRFEAEVRGLRAAAAAARGGVGLQPRLRRDADAPLCDHHAVHLEGELYAAIEGRGD